jgi:hypothetical protein
MNHQVAQRSIIPVAGCKREFLKWFHSFIEISKPTERKLLVLLLDGDESQTESLELIELARTSHVVLMCFPSHTAHRLQPLDASFGSFEPVLVY